MQEHELRQMLTINVHKAKRELKDFVTKWEQSIPKGVNVTEVDVTDFKEISAKVNQLSIEFENAFLEYQKARQQFEEKRKMESHKFNPESVSVLSQLYKKMQKVEYLLESSDDGDNIKYLQEDLSVPELIKLMEEFLGILKK